MRLICPNCDAQYELSEGAIPAEGRDVQCSNCGHAWFQVSPEVESAQRAEENLFDEPEDAASEDEFDDNFEAELAASLARVEPEPEAGFAPEPEPEPAPPIVERRIVAPEQDYDDTDDAPQHFAPPTPLPRRTMDESLIAVLREEAEREARVRSAEPPRGLEMQGDLGLESAAAISSAARRIAQMKGIDPDAPPREPTRPQTRLEMLPDIEEINSTLRPSTERGAGRGEIPMIEVSQSKTGFRSGFVLMMILAVMLVMLYVMAPRIAEQIPGAAAGLKAYVAMVDTARVFLDALMQRAIAGLQG